MELLVGLLISLAVLLIGVGYQALGSARDARRFPPPGHMVDVGGHRLHVYCAGEGSPTVVLDSGLPGSSLSWRVVQSEVAKFCHVCSYDRAGLGWSDPGPRPRTSQRIVEELHTLLTNAGMKGPYVLVGHSFGAFNARLYASKYADEVAGMVFVDPLHPREWLQMTQEQKRKVKWAVRLARYGALLARLGIARLVLSLGRAGALGTARSLVSLLTGGVLRGREGWMASVQKLPRETRPVVGVFWTQPKCYEAIAEYIQALPESAAQVAATNGYGDLPLVVLSAGAGDAARQLEQEALVRLSSCGRHLVASKSGHWIQLDQPELVVRAIREVVDAARGRRLQEPTDIKLSRTEG